MANPEFWPKLPMDAAARRAGTRQMQETIRTLGVETSQALHGLVGQLNNPNDKAAAAAILKVNDGVFSAGTTPVAAPAAGPQPVAARPAGPAVSGSGPRPGLTPT
ncbi:MAG: hypothetical protein AB7H77_10035 [Bdellovibrionales bacterium]